MSFVLLSSDRPEPCCFLIFILLESPSVFIKNITTENECTDFFLAALLIFLYRTDNNNRNFCIADLIQCTNEMNVNIPQLADSLFERTTNSSWVVVFKSLITTHHLMVYGNEVIQKWYIILRTVAVPHSCKCHLNASTNYFCKTIFRFAFLDPTLNEHRSHFLFVSVVSTSKCAILV